MARPQKLTHPLYELLVNEDVQGFNNLCRNYESIDFRGGDFRGLNLRGLNAQGIDFRDAYLRSCDLRGIDFREALLEGASLNKAQISGCYFAKHLSAEEILMSITAGTRLRRCA